MCVLKLLKKKLSEMLICFVYHFYYKTNKKKLIDSRSMNHAEKCGFDPSHDSAVRPYCGASYRRAVGQVGCTHTTRGSNAIRQLATLA